MNEIITETYAEINGTYNGIKIPAKQHDVDSRILSVLLLKDGAEYKIPGGVAARVAGTKPDGKQIINDCEIINNKVQILLTEQMLIVDGTLKLEVMIFKDKTLLTSAVLKLNIFASAYTPERIESKDEYKSFIKALIRLEKAIKEATEVINESKQATAESIEATKESKSVTKECKELLERINKILVDGGIKVFDPVDGKQKTVQGALYSMREEYTSWHGDRLKCAEYDKLNLTAKKYDDKQITAYNYDLYGKKYLQ